jgi:hypothetical protein
LPPNTALSAIAASAAKLRKVERPVENLVERMDLILPAIGRLLVASRPAAMPAGTLLRLMPGSNSRCLRLMFSIR